MYSCGIVACGCNTDGTVGGVGNCNNVSGQCVCKANVDSDAGRLCAVCKESFFNLTNSNPLGCQGVLVHYDWCLYSHINCHMKNGFSTQRMVGYRYVMCNVCFLCAACVCDVRGSTACNATTGTCSCKVNVEQPACSTCKVLYNEREGEHTSHHTCYKEDLCCTVTAWYTTVSISIFVMLQILCKLSVIVSSPLVALYIRTYARGGLRLQPTYITVHCIHYTVSVYSTVYDLFLLILCARMASTALLCLIPVGVLPATATVLAPSPLSATRPVGSALVWTMWLASCVTLHRVATTSDRWMPSRLRPRRQLSSM